MLFYCGNNCKAVKMQFFADIVFTNCETHSTQYLFKKLPFAKAKQQRARCNRTMVRDNTGAIQKIEALDGKNVICAVGCSGTAFLVTGTINTFCLNNRCWRTIDSWTVRNVREHT